MGDARTIPCGGRCGLQGFNALQPVLQNSPRQCDPHIRAALARVDGFLERSAPVDGDLGHFHGRTIRQTTYNDVISLRHRDDIILVHHV